MRWCRGNIGEKIFAPWIDALRARGVAFEFGARVTDFEIEGDAIAAIQCSSGGGGGGGGGGAAAAPQTTAPATTTTTRLAADAVVFAVGMGALKGLGRSPALAPYAEVTNPR